MKHNGEGVAVARWMAECRPWDGDEPVRVEALAPGVLPALRRDYNRWAFRKDRAVFDARDGRTRAAFRAAWNGAVLALEAAVTGEAGSKRKEEGKR